MSEEENGKHEQELKPLSPSDLTFINRYFEQHFNGTQAYLVLHPKSSYNAARSSAADLLAKPNIKTEIARRIAEQSMSADEALQRMADFARGDIGDFMAIGPMGFSLDLNSAREAGITKLIKKVKQKTTTFIAKKPSDEDREVTEIEIELYDAQAAVRDVLKVHGKFNDTNFNLDLTQLSTSQLERIANGENVLAVLATPGES